MNGCMDISFQGLNLCKLKGRAVKRFSYNYPYTNRHVKSIDDLVNKFIDDSFGERMNKWIYEWFYMNREIGEDK